MLNKTFMPPITYVIENISGEADVAFAFNENGLYKSGYSWTFKDSENAEEAIRVLAEDFNSNENLIANDIEIPDLSKDSEQSFPFRFEWSIADKLDRHVELSVLELKDNFVVQLTIGI